MYCRQCGKEVAPGARFCTGCGAAVGKTSPRLLVPRGIGRKIWIAAGSLAGIALLAAVGTFAVDKWRETRAASLFNEASQLVDQADRAHKCSFFKGAMENHALSELRTNSVKDHSAYLAAFRDYGAAIAKARRVIKDYPSTPSAMKLTQTDSRIGAYTLSELEETIIPRMGQMAWTMAAGRGDIEIVRGLLKEGIGRNAEGNGGPYKGFTALHAAAAGGSVEIIKLLLKVGADPNGVGESSADGGGEYTPLTEAAAEGHAEIVKVLLEAGADPKSKASNTYGLTALGHALQGGHGDIVKMLVAAGANLTNAPSDMHSATFLAAVEGGFADIVGRLLKAGAHPDSCAGYQCMTKALLAAAERGHTEIVKLLVSAGANLDVVAGWGAGAGPEPTALGLALQHGHADIVALLKKAGAKVVSRETTTTDNITYAMKSTTIDDPKAVSVLLEKVREKGMGTHQSLRQGLDRFRQDVGRYPTTDEGFQALSERPPNIDPCKWNGSYVFDAQKQDPWGREYHYKSPGEHREYDLYSLGADNAEGGDGENADIVSWKKDGAVRPLQRSK